MNLGRWLALPLLLLCSLPQLGCAHLYYNLEPVEVFLVGLRPLPSELFEQRFEVDFRVLNPNDQDLLVDGVDFTLEVNGTRLSRGVSGEELVIPRFEEQLLTLTATTTVFDVFRQIMSAAQSSEVHYELYGRIHLANSPLSLDFHRSGLLEAPPLQP